MNNVRPRKSDWRITTSDLDQKHAYKLYAGRTNDEMYERYLIGPIAVSDELQFMPEVPFRYYMMGFSEAVKSGNYDELVRPDAPSCLLRLIIYKLKRNKPDIEPIMPQLRPIIKYIVENQEKYNADVGIYGDFHDLLEEIETLSEY